MTKSFTLTDNQVDVMDAVAHAANGDNAVDLWEVTRQRSVKHIQAVQLVLKSLVNKGALEFHEARADGQLPNWTQRWSVSPTVHMDENRRWVKED